MKLDRFLDILTLRKKTAVKENTLAELQMKLKQTDIELRELILKNYPIGAVVGIACQKEAKEYIIVGHYIEDVAIPLIQIACINPRAKNAFTVTNHNYTDVKVHGYWNDIMKGSANDD